jgi:hypothetical protein
MRKLQVPIRNTRAGLRDLPIILALRPRTSRDRAWPGRSTKISQAPGGHRRTGAHFRLATCIVLRHIRQRVVICSIIVFGGASGNCILARSAIGMKIRSKPHFSQTLE